jgi:urease accessory protein
LVSRAIRVLGVDEPREPIHDTLILGYDERRGQRASVVSNRGVRVDIDLPAPAKLRTDDVLALDTGELVGVVAAAESLFEVRAEFATLARIAWALGDRHVPAQILPNRIRLRAEPALRFIVVALGGKVAAIEAPFDPEGGAYAVTPDGHDDHRHHDHTEHGGDHHRHAHEHAPVHRDRKGDR